MKILTFNLWHGMGRTLFGVGFLERPGRRALRFRGFLDLAREADADLIFLQEANPAPSTARKIAAVLDMDEIHQVCNSGMKFPLGLPPSFRSGIIILARKGLGLRRWGAIKLPGSGWGWCWDRVSIQFREHRYALFGRVEWRGTPVLLAVTHLHQTRPLEPEAVMRIREARRKGVISRRECTRLLAICEDRVSRRGRQLGAITATLEQLAPDGPLLLCGDFNAEPGSEEIRDLVDNHGFIDTYAEAGSPPGTTWDPGKNPNTAVSSGTFMEQKSSQEEIRTLLKQQDKRPGRLDYIFLGPAGFPPDPVLSSELFAARPVSDGLFCSDHFGVLTTIRFGSG